jgi:hypothetical protein
MTLLSYDIDRPRLRASAEEWQPHVAQSRKSTESWYLTSLAFDDVGSPYFLVWCLVDFGGEETHNGSVQVPDGRRLNLGMLGLTDNKADLRFSGSGRHFDSRTGPGSICTTSPTATGSARIKGPTPPRNGSTRSWFTRTAT